MPPRYESPVYEKGARGSGHVLQWHCLLGEARLKVIQRDELVIMFVRGSVKNGRVHMFDKTL